MYLSVYHFDGDPDELAVAYDRFSAAFADVVLDLHACVTTATGISVYDTCPTLEIAEGFSKSAAFHNTLVNAGLPEPRIERLGPVYSAVTRGERVSL